MAAWFGKCAQRKFNALNVAVTTSEALVTVNMEFNVIVVATMNVEKNPSCLNYRYKAYEPGIKKKVVDMAINGSGIRDTSSKQGVGH